MLLVILNIVLALFTNERDINLVVEEYISKNLNQYENIEYSIQDDLTAIISLEINSTKSSNRIGSKFFIPVITTDNMGITKERFLTAQVKLFKNVFVATKSINRGEEISLNNIVLELRDVTEINQTPFSDMNRIGEIVSKYNVQPGDIICNEFIDSRPAIYPGDHVNASYIIGTVQVSFIGTVRQSGAIGDLIKVKANNQQYTAMVINSNEVLIIE